MSSLDSTPSTAAGRVRLPARVVVGLVIGSIAMGLAAGELVGSGHWPLVFAFGIVALYAILWRTPQLAPIVLLAAALTIEQFPASDGPPGGTFTDRIRLFYGITNTIHINFADLAVLSLFVLCLLKRGTGSVTTVPRSATTFAIAALAGAVVIGLLIGRAHGGSLRTSFTEVRPYFYLVTAYMLAATFGTRREIVRWAMWAIVLGSGAKAIQAVVMFFSVRGMRPRPQAILGHEEALFFGLFVVLTCALWLFGVRGRLRVVATWLLPIVLLADMVNGRRVAWLILPVGLVVLAVIGLVTRPERRRMLLGLLGVALIISAVYLPAYWNHTGSIALPARTVRSAFGLPDARDSSSDLYRLQENANLLLNIRQGGMLGKGFGVPIDYALPIDNIASLDPLIEYIPHDGVLYILMRMGLLGGIAFWSVLGAGIIGASRLARSMDRELACFGAFLACAVVGYAILGYNDQGFFFYRVALVIGTLLGLGEVATRFALNSRARQSA